MQTKEELLQYLRNNYKNAGHPLYYSGTNKINFFFKGKVPINDIEDFLQRNHSYTSNKKTSDKFYPLTITKTSCQKGKFEFSRTLSLSQLIKSKQNSKIIRAKVRENSNFPFVVGLWTLNTKGSRLE